MPVRISRSTVDHHEVGGVTLRRWSMRALLQLVHTVDAALLAVPRRVLQLAVLLTFLLIIVMGLPPSGRMPPVTP